MSVPRGTVGDVSTRGDGTDAGDVTGEDGRAGREDVGLRPRVQEPGRADLGGAARRRLVAWRGTDPDRVDVAVVDLHPDRLAAHGTSTGDEHLLRYRLTTDVGWVTQRFEVVVEAGGVRRELDLRREPSGSWTARRTVYEPGDWWVEDVELGDLDGAEDVDLALCPLTNTMPVLRGGFLEASRRGGSLTRTVTTAWVDLPHLTVEPSRQTYRALPATADGAPRVRYRSDGLDGEELTAELVLDPDGLVLEYPGVGVRIDG